MSGTIEFTNTCKDFNMSGPNDIASLKCDGTQISFLSRARWIMANNNMEDANKLNIQKFLVGESNILIVMLQGAGTVCNIKIAENRLNISAIYDCGNFSGACSLSCQYDFENNKYEIHKFLNYRSHSITSPPSGLGF